MQMTKAHTRAFSSNFWKSAPGQYWKKMIDLTSKLGAINHIEHNKDSYISSKSSYFSLYYSKHTTYAQVLKYHPDMGHCFS